VSLAKSAIQMPEGVRAGRVLLSEAVPPADVDPTGRHDDARWHSDARRQVVPTPTKEGVGGRRTYACTFMAAGRVKMADQQPSDWHIPASAIAEAQALFDGRPVYLDHPDLGGFAGIGMPWHQEPKVARLVGITFGPQWDPAAQAMTGGIRLYDRAEGSPGWLVGRLFDQILEDQAAGREVPPIGLSAVFFHTAHLDADTGLRVTDRIEHIESVDIVYDPGAAGYIKAALAACGGAGRSEPVCAPTRARSESVFSLLDSAVSPIPEGDLPMSEPTAVVLPSAVGAPLVGAPSASAPPDSERLASERHDSQRLASDRLASERLDQLEAESKLLSDHSKRLSDQLDRLTRAMVAVAEDRAVKGVEPSLPGGVRGMQSSLDQVSAAVEAMLSGVRPAGNVQPLTGVRELYTLLSGDYEMTGRFNADRVYLANVNTSTMAGLVANALNKRVVNQYQEYPRWWEPAVTEEDFATLQQIRFITLGGIGDLPTVNEGAAYTELTWDDSTETADFVKKGGYLGLTLEAIDKDDTRRLQAAPRALAQAAWLTLGKTIAALFTANSGYGATMADAHYVFDASNHSNLGSTAFSHEAWVATKILMMKVTEVNSGERLAALTKPYLIWVPVDLEDAAVAELATGEGEIGNADYHVNADALANALTDRLSRARERVIVCPFWTDANDWVAQANPLLYPGLGLGYRYGRTPEIYSVASPTAGLMFTNDTMPIKVRFFFAAGFTDYRAWYKHIVA